MVLNEFIICSTIIYFEQIARSVKTLQTKWKNIKAIARRRESLARKAQSATGGGSLAPHERRVVESSLYNDVVNKLGVSAKGNNPRFDSDGASTSGVPAPTPRLHRVMSMDTRSESSRMSTATPSSLFADLDIDGTFPPPATTTATAATSSTATSSHSGQSNRSTDEPLSKRARISTPTGALDEHLAQQQENNLLHKQYLTFQIERAKIAKEREKLQTRLVEIDIEKANALKNIEIDKQQKLADLEILAKRREMGME